MTLGPSEVIELPAPSIAEMRQAKNELATQITELIDKFQNQYGVLVQGIQVRQLCRVIEGGQYSPYAVHADIEVAL